MKQYRLENASLVGDARSIVSISETVNNEYSFFTLFLPRYFHSRVFDVLQCNIATRPTVCTNTAIDAPRNILQRLLWFLI
jgi:hypothetical protein